MNLIMLLIVILVVIATVLLAIYSYIAKKQRVALSKKQYKQVLHLVNQPRLARVAFWMNLDKANGKEYKGENAYTSHLKNGLFHHCPVIVAFFEPGENSFVISSHSYPEYQDISIRVNLMPNTFYRIGCDNQGPYFKIEEAPDRYHISESEVLF